MTDYVISPPEQPSIAVAGSAARFAVRRIFCIGRNYAAHAREMGKDPDREPPFWFYKPADCLRDDSATLPYPPLTQDLHYEGELVVAIGTGGRNIAVADALDHVWGYAIGNDLTRRDLQGEAKKMGRPWDSGKGFDGAAPIGPVHAVADVGHVLEGSIRSSVNGEERQNGQLTEMIWTVPEVISILSANVALCPGDLIMTGTPAGVGTLVEGDVCVVEVEGLGRLTTTIGARG